MRFLVAPDGFKGSLTAPQAARAMRRGARAGCPDASVDVCPLSDGGEGFAEVLGSALGGVRQRTRVTGPLGEPVEACWCLLPDGTALLESATAAGLALVPEGRRDATRTTSFARASSSRRVFRRAMTSACCKFPRRRS